MGSSHKLNEIFSASFFFSTWTSNRVEGGINIHILDVSTDNYVSSSKRQKKRMREKNIFMAVEKCLRLIKS